MRIGIVRLEAQRFLEQPRGVLCLGRRRRRWPQAFLWSRVGAIAGGTSEVQVNNIAQRMLGLPR